MATGKKEACKGDEVLWYLLTGGLLQDLRCISSVSQGTGLCVHHISRKWMENLQECGHSQRYSGVNEYPEVYWSAKANIYAQGTEFPSQIKGRIFVEKHKFYRHI